MKLVCVVPSAGKGKRLASKKQKPFIILGKKPILVHTLQVLNKNKLVQSIILVVPRSRIGYCENLVKKYRFKKVKNIVAGGAKRFDSVRNGILKIEKADFVMVHDGVRPFINESLIRKVFSAAKKHGAAISAVPVTQTVKSASRSLFISRTLKRKTLWEVQTPQVFKKDLIVKGYKKVRNRNATDSASLVEKLGHKVRIIRGSYRNIKITTPEDLELAKMLLKITNYK